MRQQDLGAAAGISQAAISLIERGHWEALSVRALRRVFGAVDAAVVISVAWRGGALDRLLDERHAALAGHVADDLRRHGWRVLPEVTFNHFGERGSIDLLACHVSSGTLLVVEVKTELTSIEETLRRHDTKLRLAPALGVERFGERPRSTVRLLVVLDTTVNRARVARQDAVLTRAYPMRGIVLRRWLRDPAAPKSGEEARGGLRFVRLTNPRGGMRGTDRIRVRTRTRPGRVRA